MVWEHEIPDFLIMDCGIQLVPSGNWTLEEQGTKRVEIAGINDWRMITATFTSTRGGSRNFDRRVLLTRSRSASGVK